MGGKASKETIEANGELEGEKIWMKSIDGDRKEVGLVVSKGSEPQCLIRSEESNWTIEIPWNQAHELVDEFENTKRQKRKRTKTTASRSSKKRPTEPLTQDLPSDSDEPSAKEKIAASVKASKSKRWTDETRSCMTSPRKQSETTTERISISPRRLPFDENQKSDGDESFDEESNDEEWAKPSLSSTRQTGGKWTDEESKYLEQAVETHGFGNWKLILLEGAGHFKLGRNNVDLKDRYRVIMRSKQRGTSTRNRRRRHESPELVLSVEEAEKSDEEPIPEYQRSFRIEFGKKVKPVEISSTKTVQDLKAEVSEIYSKYDWDPEQMDLLARFQCTLLENNSRIGSLPEEMHDLIVLMSPEG